MAYIFRGFFTTPADGLIQDAAARWPGASVKAIHEHFNGIGLRLPDSEAPDPEQYQAVVNSEKELLEWSKRYPQNVFVYLLVECFGGACDHFGYAWKNGEMIETVNEEQEDGLIRLMSHLGASLGIAYSRTYFRPFERDYPW